ncbi:MAG: MFS transporter [Chloroflexia bacterium]
MSNSVETQADRGSVWRNRDFVFLWSGQTISTLGTAASSVVFPLLILFLSGSPAAAGIAGALSSLPYLLFSLPVGALIDRWDRKLVMVLSDLGRALSLASIPATSFFGVLTIEQLYVNAFIEGTLFVFYNIAETAALTRVVPKHQLPAAYAQNQVADTLAFLVGPSVGTLLYQGVSKMAPFIVDAVSYVGSVITLLFIRKPLQAERQETIEKKDLLREIREGISWWWQRPLLRFQAFLNSGLSLLFSSPLLLIILAKELGAQDADVGLILSVASLGGIVGTFIGRWMQRRFTYGQAVPSVVLYQAIIFPFIALSPNLLVFALAVALSFAMWPAYDVVQYTYRLAMIPDALQGRVNSSFRLIAWGTRPLGAVLTGFLIEWVGARSTTLAFAGLFLALSLAAFANIHVRNAPPLETLSGE